MENMLHSQGRTVVSVIYTSMWIEAWNMTSTTKCNQLDTSKAAIQYVSASDEITQLIKNRLAGA